MGKPVHYRQSWVLRPVTDIELRGRAAYEEQERARMAEFMRSNGSTVRRGESARHHGPASWAVSVNQGGTMDLAQERLHLQEVERTIAVSEFRLGRQRGLVERAHELGGSTADELQMLTALESTLGALYNLRNAIRVTVSRLEREW
jgi:hypothetical protein